MEEWELSVLFCFERIFLSFIQIFASNTNYHFILTKSNLIYTRKKYMDNTILYN